MLIVLSSLQKKHEVVRVPRATANLADLKLKMAVGGDEERRSDEPSVGIMRWRLKGRVVARLPASLLLSLPLVVAFSLLCSSFLVL